MRYPGWERVVSEEARRSKEKRDGARRMTIRLVLVFAAWWYRKGLGWLWCDKIRFERKKTNPSTEDI